MLLLGDPHEVSVHKPSRVVFAGSGVAHHRQPYVGADAQAVPRFEPSPLQSRKREVLPARPWRDRMAFGLQGPDGFQRIQADRPIHPAVVLDAPLTVACYPLDGDAGFRNRQLRYAPVGDIDLVHVRLCDPHAGSALYQNPIASPMLIGISFASLFRVPPRDRARGRWTQSGVPGGDAMTLP